jgi:hypothetical protein
MPHAASTTANNRTWTNEPQPKRPKPSDGGGEMFGSTNVNFVRGFLDSSDSLHFRLRGQVWACCQAASKAA